MGTHNGPMSALQRRFWIVGVACGLWAASAAFCWLLLLEAGASR